MYITLPESSSALQTDSNVLTGILFLLFVSSLPPPPFYPPPSLSACRSCENLPPAARPSPRPPAVRGPRGAREAGSGDRRAGRRPSAGARWHAASLPCHPPPRFVPAPTLRGRCGDPLAALAARHRVRVPLARRLARLDPAWDAASAGGGGVPLLRAVPGCAVIVVGLCFALFHAEGEARAGQRCRGQTRRRQIDRQMDRL